MSETRSGTGARIGALGLAVGAAMTALFTSPTAAAALDKADKAVPINIVINQSPWYRSFERLIKLYEEQTGNKVNLDVNPMPATQEKQRNSLRAAQGDYDLMPVNSQILSEVYLSGLLEPLESVDPAFKMNPDISTFSGTACWDAQRKAYDCKTGKLMGVPILGNVQLLYYRADLYRQKGLQVPKTLVELEKNAAALHSPQIAGLQHQDARGAPDISWGFMPIMHAFGGRMYKDPDNGDFTLTMNSAETLKALQWYIETIKKYGSGTPGSTGQGKLIQLLTTGKLAHAVIVVAAAAQMDDPAKSVVAGKIAYAPIPAGPAGHSTTLGHFIGGIPKNIPAERKKAAITFLKWFQQPDVQARLIEMDGIPVDSKVLAAYASKDPKYRWADALAQSYEHTDNFMYAEGGAVVPILDLRLNQAVIGSLGAKEALNQAAREISEALAAKGYKTGFTELK